jgi:DNA segregation ATPase FtsK/SpoIIIE-like protein
MRTAAARARDREQTRQLNLAEQARVRARDAGYAAGWNATRAAGGADRAAADHAAALDRYERDMAAWRRAVAACNAGDRDACR